MSQVQLTNNLRQAQNSLLNSGEKKPGDKSLGKDDFMHLLLTQMTHQDPTSPMDSQGMMQQFAQMGTMEQLQNLNEKVESLNATQLDVSRATAATYLEKDVTVRGSMASLSKGVVQPVGFDLPNGSDVSVYVMDGEGKTVRRMEMHGLEAGRHVINWDGKDEAGDAALDGSYRYKVLAKNGDEHTPVDLFMSGKVSGVRFADGRPMLKIFGGEVDAREVTGIDNRSEKTFNGLQPLPLADKMNPKPPVIPGGVVK